MLGAVPAISGARFDGSIRFVRSSRPSSPVKVTEFPRFLTLVNIAYWETSDKPPRSNVLPEMAKALGVRVEDLIGSARVAPAGRPGPVGKLQRALEQASALPRSQQLLVVEFVNTLVQRHRRAG